MSRLRGLVSLLQELTCTENGIYSKCLIGLNFNFSASGSVSAS